jgi:hypothetical protein
MTTNAPNVSDERLQKLIDGLVSCIITPIGYLRPAPNSFDTADYRPITPNGSSFQISIRSNNNGSSAHVLVDVHNTNGAQSVSGEIDLNILESLLA